MATSLTKKLGFKEGWHCLFVNHPVHYFDLLEDLQQITKQNGGTSESLDFIHVFVKSEEELVDRANHLKPLIKKNGMIWISWPKGKSKIMTDINRESVRAYGLKIGLVDVKVCSIDEDWSALKFVYKLKDRVA